MFIGLKELIWEDFSGTMVSVKNSTPIIKTVLIVKDKIIW